MVATAGRNGHGGSLVAGAVAARQATLREILAGGSAHTQADLGAVLRRRGFPVNQSTISRDLRAVGARRELGPEGPARYSLAGRKEEAAAPSPVSRFPFALVTAVAHNEALVLVKTRVGAASTVAVALDDADLPGILGTVAGDDTILVVPAQGAVVAALARRIRAAVWGARPRPRSRPRRARRGR
jgi:transcriptional regulator of arginine metabolism